MRRLLLLAAVAVLGGCSGGASLTTVRPPVAAVSPSPSHAVTPSVAPTLSISPTPTAVPSAQSAPTAEPSPPVERCESGRAVTIVDTLRVRSQPHVGDESIKYDPLLRKGTEVEFPDVPLERGEAGSGYWWYEITVAPGVLRGHTRGWIAAGDRDGTPWIQCLRID
jgi:hypothetical protein